MKLYNVCVCVCLFSSKYIIDIIYFFLQEVTIPKFMKMRNDIKISVEQSAASGVVSRH